MGSSPIPATRPVGQAVKTPPFHGGNSSSILLRVTNNKKRIASRSSFCCCDPFMNRAVQIPREFAGARGKKREKDWEKEPRAAVQILLRVTSNKKGP